MTALADAQRALAVHIKAHVNADPVVAAVPAAPVAGSAYVWPAADWVTVPDEPTFCGRSVGLVVDFVIGIAELEESQAWLAARLDELWNACAAGVDVGGDATTPTRSFVVGIVRTQEGAELLVARTEFARFTLED